MSNTTREGQAGERLPPPECCVLRAQNSVKQCVRLTTWVVFVSVQVGERCAPPPRCSADF